MTAQEFVQGLLNKQIEPQTPIQAHILQNILDLQVAIVTKQKEVDMVISQANEAQKQLLQLIGAQNFLVKDLEIAFVPDPKIPVSTESV